jgi:2-succinyl-6-hydroxy-2,4-cyclohexadiene-1-carboxylate synthase
VAGWRSQERVLHAEIVGSGPPLVLAHGFTQTGRSWGRFGELLAPGHRLILVDLPGHGSSATVEAGLVDGGDLLVEAGGEQPFDLLGYSLGARFALHAALAYPGAVRRLVLIGATAGIEDPQARDARRRRDEALAEEIQREADVLPFLERWLSGPMFAGLRDPGLEERRRNTPAGLASSLRLAGTGTQEPLWGRLGHLECPTLLLAGADDVRFAIAARRMAGLAPHAVVSLVPGAGHAAHLAQPVLTARIVQSFLA